ncbi:hypothetical protein AXF42_Ash015389 [Apostasia shenzhenica]|uniref:Uncharacterized protein n=1 Tax=Apostasia shenzhenica TaxID=1088818 RepID=A0A2H9ZS42_9ASPA|nr:hypothetical protein AXF42_Ash015389 [Apostasia shenzhenica]
MAESLNYDDELWLPPELLTDDFFHAGSDERLLPEDQEIRADGYSAGFSRRMPRSFIHSDEELYSMFCKENPKAMAASDLCDDGRWGNRKPAPPTQTGYLDLSRRDAWDLLYSRAETLDQVYAKELHPSFPSPATVNAPKKSCAPPKCSSDGLYPNHSLTQRDLQLAQFYYLKHQQLIKHQLSTAWSSSVRIKGVNATAAMSYEKNMGCGPPEFAASPAFPPSHPPAHGPQPGSGLRAVFLKTRKESSGTGVFLPRHAGSADEPRKKQACSTVLLPARVIQALNLNLDELSINPRIPSHDMVSARNQKGNIHRQMQATGDTRLPPEWTY